MAENCVYRVCYVGVIVSQYVQLDLFGSIVDFLGTAGLIAKTFPRKDVPTAQWEYVA
jgi:hypothetical protein